MHSIVLEQFQINFDDLVIANVLLVNNGTESVTYDVQFAPLAPVYLYMSAISLAAVSAFLKSGFIIKLLLMLLFIGVQCSLLWQSSLFETYQILNNS